MCLHSLNSPTIFAAISIKIKKCVACDQCPTPFDIKCMRPVSHPLKNCEAVHTMLNPENAVFRGVRPVSHPSKNCEAVHTMLNPENAVF